MAKKITFHKIVGTGNDFVVIDNRKNLVADPCGFAITVCKRHTGIGADGVILLERSKIADLKMRIINADGSEAEMCGNGMRCAAWAATKILKMNSQLTFETLAGTNETSVTDDSVRVKLPDPTDFRDYAPLEVKDGIFYFYFVNTGVPHCVIFEDKLEEFPVFEIGREIRYHPHFQPAGANVNFVQIIDDQTIAVRTYERGVEKETQACGTGSTAAAIASVLIKKCSPPITAITKSKEKLVIDFDSSMYTISNVFLEGPVRHSFDGYVLTE
jgi:diaminopimelate epimerase